MHHPEFDAGKVDQNMHDRLIRSVEECKMDIIDMWQDGGFEQDVHTVRFFKWKVEVVLRELLADKRQEGCQHFVFKEYKKLLRTLMEDEVSEVTPMVPSRFNWPRRSWVRARC